MAVELGAATPYHCSGAAPATSAGREQGELTGRVAALARRGSGRGEGAAVSRHERAARAGAPEPRTRLRRRQHLEQHAGTGVVVVDRGHDEPRVRARQCAHEHLSSSCIAARRRSSIPAAGRSGTARRRRGARSRGVRPAAGCWATRLPAPRRRRPCRTPFRPPPRCEDADGVDDGGCSIRSSATSLSITDRRNTAASRRARAR